MFNLDQGMVGARNDNPAETLRLKRPLSVIEEHVYEDFPPDEGSKLGNTRAVNNDDRSSSQLTLNGTGIDSHLRANAVKKTRKKVVFGERSPVLPCFPKAAGDSVDALGSIHEDKVPPPFLAGSEHKTQLKDLNQEPKNQNKDSTTTKHRHHPKESGTEWDLSRLKDTATKLNLKTRRQSYLTWRAEYVDKPRDAGSTEVKVERSGEERLTTERKERIDKDLQWIKGQLIDLRRQDQSLARQLLGIRHELSNLRLAASCEEHRDLLDDAEDHVQELRELSCFVDFPPELLTSSSLKHIGVTKMNLSSRRFSAC
ncbi:hypothetical protein ACOMHN_043716 [Nucella lapillus]